MKKQTSEKLSGNNQAHKGKLREALGIDDERFSELKSDMIGIFSTAETKPEVFDWIRNNDNLTDDEALFVAYKFGAFIEFLERTELSILFEYCDE